MFPDFYLCTQFKAERSEADWPECFVIITAFATTGETWTEAQNEAADLALRHELEQRGLWHCRIIGYSPDGLHAEPGWAVQVPWVEGCDLGLAFKQDAIYVVQGDSLLISYCDARRGLVPVGAFRSRVTAIE